MPTNNGRPTDVFTTGQVAEICKVSQQTVIRCFDKGQLKGFRVPGSRFRRIPRDSLIAFMKANHIPLDRLEAPDVVKRVLVVTGKKENSRLEAIASTLGSREEVLVEVIGSTFEACARVIDWRPHRILIDHEPDNAETAFLVRGSQEHSIVDDLRIYLVVEDAASFSSGEEKALLAAGVTKILRQPAVDPRTQEIVDLVSPEQDTESTTADRKSP